jgi:hypothetical protein
MNIEAFKESITKTMIQNFKDDGFLVPAIVALSIDAVVPAVVPEDLLSDEEGKAIIIGAMKRIAQVPGVKAVAFIFEAYGLMAVIGSEEDQQQAEGKSLQDIKGSRDIIVCVLSTPERDEIVSYFVDPKQKLISEPFIIGDTKMAGSFSKFSAYTRN